MSKANELHNGIMEVLIKGLKSGDCTYADIFGALKATQGYFECDYVLLIHAGIIKANDTNETDNAPSI